MTWVVLSLSGWAKDIQQRHQPRRRYGLGLHKEYNFDTLFVSEDNESWTYRALFSRAQGSCHQRPRPQYIDARCAVNKESVNSSNIYISNTAVIHAECWAVLSVLLYTFSKVWSLSIMILICWFTNYSGQRNLAK